jgi:C4-dicarboxylate transporter DctM subunit
MNLPSSETRKNLFSAGVMMEILFLLAVFLGLLLAGINVATAMLLASIIHIISLGLPGVIVAERLLSAINTFPLLAVPFFILGGAVMNQAGLTKRLVDLSKAFVGHFHGGTAHVTVLASMFFAGISGSASADASAIGSILIPTMKKEGYDPGFAVGVTATAACIGPIIPPSLVMVIYGSMTNVSIGKLFLAGVFPGILIGFGLMGIVAVLSRKYNYPRHEKTPWAEKFKIMVRSIPALIAPLIIVGGITSGYYTATEAGVVACVYGVFVGFFVYRDLKIPMIKPLLEEAVVMTAVPIFILASASIFGWLLTYHGLGSLIMETINNFKLSPLMLLFALFTLFFILGLFLEGLAVMIIFVPVLMPLVPQFGYNEIHFALIIIITILIGTATPPFGLQLFICMAIGRVPMRQVIIWPFIFSMCVVTWAVILYPPITTWLPQVLIK